MAAVVAGPFLAAQPLLRRKQVSAAAFFHCARPKRCTQLRISTPKQQLAHLNEESHPYDFFLRHDDPKALGGSGGDSGGNDEGDASSVDVGTATAGGYWGSPSEVRQRLWSEDPGLNQDLISSGTTISQIFNQDKWNSHRSSSRYLVHLLRIPNSTVFRRVLLPCCALTAVAAAICAYNTLAPAHLARLALSTVPHLLLGAAISLQLVFRTNGSYSRFQEGRLLWGQLLHCARDWARLVAVYFPYALSTRAAAYVQAMAFCLKSKVRPPLKSGGTWTDDSEMVVRQLLPAVEAEEVLGQRNRCYYLLCKMTALMQEARGCMPQYAARRLDYSISTLTAVVGGCERILGTPIPLSYTRHTTRCLVLWLATLPMALWPCVGWATVPTMFAMCFIFMGIDEIGVEIEEPFCILPLMPLCKTVMRDVCDAMELAPRRRAHQA